MTLQQRIGTFAEQNRIISYGDPHRYN
jgi:hypothetical protein